MRFKDIASPTSLIITKERGFSIYRGEFQGLFLSYGKYLGLQFACHIPPLPFPMHFLFSPVKKITAGTDQSSMDSMENLFPGTGVHQLYITIKSAKTHESNS